MIKRDLMFCCLGNGLSVCDRLHEEHGDYAKVAHIGADRVITYYIKDLAPEYIERIEKEANYSDPAASESQAYMKVFNTRPLVGFSHTQKILLEKSIHQAYRFLRENNHLIPDEHLDFIKFAALKQLKAV